VNRHIVLTAIGQDRPGLVEEVSEFVLAHGGSIEDSRMANLQGQFAIMVLIGAAQEAIDRIRADLDALTSQTRVHAQVTEAVTAGVRIASRLPFRLTGRALDQPGLVHVVANLLRSLNVNIESMDTTLEAAPITAAPVFAMDLIIAVPTDTPVPKLRDELTRVCDPRRFPPRLLVPTQKVRVRSADVDDAEREELEANRTSEDRSERPRHFARGGQDKPLAVFCSLTEKPREGLVGDDCRTKADVARRL
jgi:glycine cleavage system transcriptional repressor